ncbi:hypothetical protein ABTW44_12990 [Morganella morganii]|uniref:hypothetical protein n=2 Tax=Morganella morganii TaxID=582 RepID=UPI0013C57C90|nr:hypothetical protein [Morganella morganii]HDT0714046.1 hypothetical protein [Morganella morganii subsp. morganii]NGE94944.1 hypothetical protein [Morganella morganii]HCD1110736.1 hypothetical protein [Morganella morganii]HCT2376402.1 hypothetical protein [Morganella morganii]HCT9735584.1 hypothetical protein [Morganella morganii]
MKKIGDVTSTADKNGEWTNGNVAAGIAPTILEAGWLNSVQREILGVIIAAGMQQDKNDDTQLSKAISKIISGGDYATKTEVNSKLAKDQNGADIPNKDTFIKNLGLPELLDKKFDKTGGKITGQTDIEAPGGRTQTLKAKAGTSVYQELYLQDIFAAWWGITAGNKLSLENRITGNTLTIGTDGFKIDGKNIATTDQLFGVGQTYKNLTSSRQNKVWYTNTDSKPRIIHVESNRTGTQYPFSIDIQIIDTGGQNRGDYRWTAADEVVSLTATIPPGARYSVNGGWGQPTEWVVINSWLEMSL